MTNRVLFIDAQVFQGGDRYRGMGRYSLELIKALMTSSQYKYQKTYLIFSSKRALAEDILKKIINIAPEAERLFLDLTVPTEPTLMDISLAEKNNEQILNKILAKKVRRNSRADFLLPALFLDDSYSVFPSFTNNVLVGYDLIPLLYYDRYIKHPNYESYLSRYRTIFKADHILTISQTSLDDFAIYLGISEKKLHNIGGAAIDFGSQNAKKPSNLTQQTRFILMPSGDDFRKNNLNAIMGFEKYRLKKKDTSLKLIITSNFSKETKKELYKLSDKIEFVGNVHEEEMKWLFENSECILFVPEYEGLGLPVLEGIKTNKPIVCSSLNIFREISKTAFYYVDHLNPSSIAEGLRRAIDQTNWPSKKRLYTAILERYSWNNVALKALEVLDITPSFVRHTKKRRIAIFCPTPEGYSAIGKVVMQQHALLSDLFEVDYYTEDTINRYIPLQQISYLDRIANVYKATDFNLNKYREYETIFYHIGNSEYHLETIKNALYLPGIVIVHDTNLSTIFKGLLHEKGYVSTSRMVAEERLNELNKNHETNFLTSIVNAQRAVIVHSQYAKNAIRSITRGAFVENLNLPTSTPQFMMDRTNKKRRIGIAGILAPIKGVRLLEQVAVLPEFSSCEFYIFGFSLLSEEDINRLKRHDNIKVNMNLTDFEFQSQLSKLDILINYRLGYNGETSLTVIEAMRYGVVPIVRDIGWYSELPQNSVIHIQDENQLVSALNQAITDMNAINRMAKSGQRYIRQHYQYEAYAKGMAQILDRIKTDPRLQNTFNAQLEKLLKKGASPQSLKRLFDKRAI